MSSPLSVESHANEYCVRGGIARLGRRGEGKDGAAWHTTRPSALKLHAQPESYRSEIVTYIRFLELGLTRVAGFAIPKLIDYDDTLLAIEMDIDFPPFVVDFASARLDVPDDLIEDDGNTMHDMVRERFGNRADEVMGIHYQLADRAGVYLTDLHGHNIKF